MSKVARRVSETPESNRISSFNTKSFKYWQNRTLYSIIIGYAAFYLVRQNFVMTFPALQAEFGFSKVQLGLVLTFFSIIYGVGKVVSGSLSDRSNARYFMAFGLLASALINIMMGFNSTLMGFTILWSINACFQSMGAPPCARLLTHWFTPQEIGTKWAIWNISHQVGGALVFACAGYVIQTWGWQQAFLLPALLTILVSGFLVERLRDTPQSLGLMPADQGIPSQQSQSTHLTLRQILGRVFKNKYVWYVCWANFFLYIVRMGVFNWAPTFLREFKGSSLNMAGWQSAAFEIAGIFGGIIAGRLSDKKFSGRRGPVGVLFMVALGVIILYLWKVPAGNALMDALSLFCVGFLVYGPQVLIGVAATDFSSKEAAGAASGLTGTFGYLGSSLAGVGIGWTVESFGWDYAFILFIASSFLGAFFLALTWKQGSQRAASQKPTLEPIKS